MQQPTYEKFPIETVADDGTLLKGVIHYWGKGFYFTLDEPFRAKFHSGHLIYSIPVKYGVDSEKGDHYTNESGWRIINLYDKGKLKLKELYEEKKREEKEKGVPMKAKIIKRLKVLFKSQK